MILLKKLCVCACVCKREKISGTMSDTEWESPQSLLNLNDVNTVSNQKRDSFTVFISLITPVMDCSGNQAENHISHFPFPCTVLC